MKKTIMARLSKDEKVLIDYLRTNEITPTALVICLRGNMKAETYPNLEKLYDNLLANKHM